MNINIKSENIKYVNILIKKSEEPRPILKHISGIKGVFIKKYTPTGHYENIMIDCGDGLKYHAPSNEFTVIVSQNNYI